MGLLNPEFVQKKCTLILDTPVETLLKKNPLLLTTMEADEGISQLFEIRLGDGRAGYRHRCQRHHREAHRD